MNELNRQAHALATSTITQLMSRDLEPGMAKALLHDVNQFLSASAEHLNNHVRLLFVKLLNLLEAAAQPAPQPPAADPERLRLTIAKLEGKNVWTN